MTTDPTGGPALLDLTAPANFSPCRRWRWSLSRPLNVHGSRPLISCGYNPSDAAEEKNDPTIRREISFGKAWGCSLLIKVNAFAGVATNPDDLALMDDPVGAINDEVIRQAAQYAQDHDGILLATWGAPKGKAATRRIAAVRLKALASRYPWQALRVTKSGHPQHPLYLPGDLTPQPLEVRP